MLLLVKYKIANQLFQLNLKEVEKNAGTISSFRIDLSFSQQIIYSSKVTVCTDQYIYI